MRCLPFTDAHRGRSDFAACASAVGKLVELADQVAYLLPSHNPPIAGTAVALR